MKIFDACLLRLKQAARVTSDQDVAELLGMTKASLSERKRRDSFPADKLRALAQQRPELGIDVEQVLSGVSSAASNATSVLRECTEQVMLLGLPSTASIAVRDIVFGTRTGNAQLVLDGMALLSASAPMAHAQPPAQAPAPSQHATSGGINQINHGHGAVQIGAYGGKVTSTVITKAKKPKE